MQMNEIDEIEIAKIRYKELIKANRFVIRKPKSNKRRNKMGKCKFKIKVSDMFSEMERGSFYSEKDSNHLWLRVKDFDDTEDDSFILFMPDNTTQITVFSHDDMEERHSDTVLFKITGKVDMSFNC